MGQIRLTDIDRAYGKLKILHGISLAIEDGEFVVLVGPSGCGKSTLLRLIAGLDQPTGGTIEIDGKDVTKVSAAQRGLAMVFQSYALYPHMTVRQNLAFGLENQRMAKEEIASRIAEAARMLEIEAYLDRRPGQLSGGERQRVALGRALLSQPRLLLLDEPLASLDIARREEVLPYLERLRDELSIPMIYVSHQFEEVLRLATHAVLLEQGRVVTQGALEDVSLHPDLRAIVGPEAVGSVLTGSVEAHGADIAGLAAIRVGANVLHVGLREARAGATVRVQLLARDVILATARPQNISVRNVMTGTISRISNDDAETHMVHVDVGGPMVLARVTRAASAALDLQQGKQVWVLVKAVSIRGHAYVRNPPSGPVRKLTY
jgi:molybdenum ABC transporter ATP-binding protein